MKKSLSLLIALAMVFGMFASMASAATTELTTAQKYQWFVDQGVLKGDPSGNPRLDSTLTRAEFATIVASVGGLKLVNTTSSFSDVKAKDWYFTAIQSASDAGLVNGIGAGKFGPKLNVTVEQVIKVAVTLAGIKPVDGAVVAGSSAWAGPYIQAATNAGLAVPSNYKANATRGQTIDVAYVVSQLKALPVLSDVTATLNADDSITVTGKVTGTADSVKVALGTAAEVAATLKDDKTFTYTTAKQAVGTYKLTVVAYDGTKASVAVTKEVTIGGFAVESATVLNGKQIAVKFNKAVQEGTATGGAGNTGYYTLNGQTLKAVSLSDDKTTVTLTFDYFKNAGLDRYAQLTVSDSLKSASGQALTAYKQAVLLSDSVAPTVSGTSYTGASAKLTFSEPVKKSSLSNNVSVNGVVVTGYDTVQTSSGIYFVYGVTNEDVTSITFYNLPVATNHSVSLIGFLDSADNRNDYIGTINIPSDTVAPTITSLTVNGATLTAKFSEPVTVAGSVYNGSVAIPGTVNSSDNTVATYDAYTWLNNSSFLNFTAVVKGYKDLVGNQGSDFSQSVTISKDTTKPVAQSAFYDADRKLVVIKFSELLNGKGSVTSVSYNYTDTNSVLYANQTWSTAGTAGEIGYDANKSDAGNVPAADEMNYLAIAVPTLAPGKYDVTIAANTVVDKAQPTNLANDQVTLSFTIGASSSTGSLVATITKDETKNGVLYFDFSENVNANALDASKFLINGSAIPTDSKITLVGSQKHVVVQLPAGFISASGTRVVKVSNIVAASGNTLKNDASTPLYLVENVKPIAQSVTLVSDSQVDVVFSETLGTLPSDVKTGITLTINNVEETITDITKDNNVLHIKVGANKLSASQTIAVKFASSKVIDQFNNTAADVTVTK